MFGLAVQTLGRDGSTMPVIPGGCGYAVLSRRPALLPRPVLRFANASITYERSNVGNGLWHRQVSQWTADAGVACLTINGE